MNLRKNDSSLISTILWVSIAVAQHYTHGRCHLSRTFTPAKASTRATRFMCHSLTHFEGRYKSSNLYSSSILRPGPQDSSFSREQSKYSILKQPQPHPHSNAKQRKRFTTELTNRPLLAPKELLCTTAQSPLLPFPTLKQDRSPPSALLDEANKP